MVDTNRLETMLESGQDSALLRFTLGTAFIKQGKLEQAIRHLSRALELDPGYSAAWKSYGKALHDSGRLEEAADVFNKGIETAHSKGDKQAAREMEVFLKRLKKRDE